MFARGIRQWTREFQSGFDLDKQRRRRFDLSWSLRKRERQHYLHKKRKWGNCHTDTEKAKSDTEIDCSVTKMVDYVWHEDAKYHLIGVEMLNHLLNDMSESDMENLFKIDVIQRLICFIADDSSNEKLRNTSLTCIRHIVYNSPKFGEKFVNDGAVDTIFKLIESTKGSQTGINPFLTLCDIAGTNARFTHRLLFVKLPFFFVCVPCFLPKDND